MLPCVGLDTGTGQSGLAQIVDRHSAAMEEGSSKFLLAIEADMRDSYILSGIALHSAGIPKEIPATAWGAFNKNVGLPGEWALPRFLGWSGFDLDAADANAGGLTALHYIASQNNPPFSTPKAVAWLIEHGAGVNAKSNRGDTPLIYMSGARNWQANDGGRS